MMNNMNNFGMNSIGINPLLMNNMNNLGMNNQPNFMDNTALNIKNIIQPYESKIRELEEIIKQKDFEIIVLKQKLNNNMLNNNFINMNMLNPMMNMNMMNDIMNQPDIGFNNKEKEIFINIESGIKIKCYKNDKMSELRNRLILTYNYKPLQGTLEENGIINGSQLGITDKVYNVAFKTNSGNAKLLIFGGNCPIKDAIKFYCDSIKGQNIYQFAINKEISFIFNSYQINIGDKKPIKDLFIDTMNPTIMVNDNKAVYGGL